MLEPFTAQLKKDSRDSATTAVEKLRELFEEISKPREFAPVLEDLRSETPMIYYLYEFDELSDEFVQEEHLRSQGGSVMIDNWLPFIPPDPHDDSPENAVLKQYRQALELVDRWGAEREKVDNYSETIEINNRFLEETKELMLPFQYGDTFQHLLNRSGIVILLHYHDVGKDFRISNNQRQRLRDVGTSAADRLLQRYAEIRRATLAKVVDKLAEKCNADFESLFGVDQNRMLDLLLLPLNEYAFPELLNSDRHSGFSAYADYEDPYDSGVR